RSLADAAIYAPVEWVPTVRHVAEYAIDNTVAFLGWMLKLFHFHLYLDAPKSARADFPRLAAPAEILEKGAIAGALPSAWTIYQRARLHPLELRAEAAAAAPPELARWRAFYARFVPPRPGDDDEIRRMFAAVRRNLESLYSDATKERQKFLEHATTLAGAIKPFLGERARVVCAVAPDLDWSRVADEGQVVYCALGAMIDPHGATSLAKMMVQDIAAWVGQRYQYGGGNLGGSGGAAPREKSRRAARADDGPPVPARAACQPFWLVADEISSFINEPFIDLLNKSRGAGLRVTIIGQTTPDLERQLGSEGARMVKGNLNTFIQLRSQLGEDAEDFSRRAGEVNVVQESRSVSMSPALGLAGHTDVNTYQANESRSYQSREVKRVPPMAVLNLPRGQAFIHAKGQVFLVSQGLMQPCATRFLSEIGMRDDAGEIQAEVAAVRRVPAPVVAPASAAVDDPPASPPTTAPATPSLRDAVFDEA
ncbi:MAG TPA: TraM recognition domain-containing protein, partial [Planctomycetota bacterium]|nr:TraM recognition domain-containing protein [Planctomycetota bacterium]